MIRDVIIVSVIVIMSVVIFTLGMSYTFGSCRKICATCL